jgi:hypothetical protein
MEKEGGRRQQFFYIFLTFILSNIEKKLTSLYPNVCVLYSCVSRLLFCGRLFFNLFSVQTCNTASAANLRCGFPCFRDDTIVVPVVLQSAILVPPCTPES